MKTDTVRKKTGTGEPIQRIEPRPRLGFPVAPGLLPPRRLSLLLGILLCLTAPGRSTAAPNPAAPESAATTGASATAAPVPAAPDFEALVRKHSTQSTQDRRWFHSHPELSGREEKTQSYLIDRLLEIPGVELVQGEWGAGVVALLQGGGSGPTVAWRTDMDALPIIEETGLDFASTCVDTLRDGRVVGVMHACGHDMHMGIALGLLRVLSEVREEMPGRLLWIAQPAEEIGAGARALLEAGLFEEGRRPKSILALHVAGTIPYGQLGSCPGWATANVDGFRLTLNGLGCHGAYPHRGVDPVTLAANVILGLQNLVAREIDVNTPAVISVGRIEGGSKSNVIPSQVFLDATVRSHDEETRKSLPERVDRCVRGLAQAAGAPDPDLEYYFGTPAGYNDPDLVEEVREIFRLVVGPENEITYAPGMGGEDFAYYGREVPGFQFRLGVGRDGREMSVHQPDFDPDERAIPLGVRVAAEVVWDQMNRSRKKF